MSDAISVMRKMNDLCLQILGDLDVPLELQTMFRAVSDELFREDISSTELRNRSGL